MFVYTLVHLFKKGINFRSLEFDGFLELGFALHLMGIDRFYLSYRIYTKSSSSFFFYVDKMVHGF